MILLAVLVDRRGRKKLAVQNQRSMRRAFRKGDLAHDPNMFHRLSAAAALSCAAAAPFRAADRIGLVVSTLNNPYFVSFGLMASQSQGDKTRGAISSSSTARTIWPRNSLLNVEDALLNQERQGLAAKSSVDPPPSRAAVREAEAPKVPRPDTRSVGQGHHRHLPYRVRQCGGRQARMAN